MGCFCSKKPRYSTTVTDQQRQQLPSQLKSQNSVSELQTKFLRQNNIRVDERGRGELKFRSVRKTNTEGPKFGNYKCKGCGRSWNSRLCWPDKYQICKRCKKPVFPYYHRELQRSDIDPEKENRQKHEKNLCQMCQQLGYSCNNLNKNYRNKFYSQAKSSRNRVRRY